MTCLSSLQESSSQVYTITIITIVKVLGWMICWPSLCIEQWRDSSCSIQDCLTYPYFSLLHLQYPPSTSTIFLPDVSSCIGYTKCCCYARVIEVQPDLASMSLESYCLPSHVTTLSTMSFFLVCVCSTSALVAIVQVAVFMTSFSQSCNVEYKVERVPCPMLQSKTSFLLSWDPTSITAAYVCCCILVKVEKSGEQV